ncbi:hypothetical protein BGW80DRAFT_420543 [Lactifluus volemus]|nr:hypothetical protein BGW80DRAFT_420543 [Lactifluus volemus]
MRPRIDLSQARVVHKCRLLVFRNGTDSFPKPCVVPFLPDDLKIVAQDSKRYCQWMRTRHTLHDFETFAPVPGYLFAIVTCSICEIITSLYEEHAV